jgi:hypothetical protein
MKNLFSIKFYLILLPFLFSYTLQAQKLYGGIEIGTKSIKMSVIDITDAEDDEYSVKDFWTERSGKTTLISKEGNLTEKAIDSISILILKNYEKMHAKYKIDSKNFIIIADSGIGLASNTNILAQKIKLLINRDLVIITAEEEAKLLLKGCIPPKKQANSMILDIGGGNTIGGYTVDTKNGNQFHPLTLDLGAITLTQIINQKGVEKTIAEFNENAFNYLPTLKNQFNKLYKDSPELVDKENVYLAGGVTWAFYTLFNGTTSTRNFNELKYEDIVYQKSIVENNFRKIENAAISNEEIKKVLKVYTQQNLIAAFSLLTQAIDEIPNLSNKKLYFAKHGQIAWFVAYVIDQEQKAEAALKNKKS